MTITWWGVATFFGAVAVLAALLYLVWDSEFVRTFVALFREGRK